MTVFHSYQDRLHDRSPTKKSLRGLARRAARRIKTGFRIIHRAIVIAKMRRVQRELMFRDIPQLPLMLDDKWDF